MDKQEEPISRMLNSISVVCALDAGRKFNSPGLEDWISKLEMPTNQNKNGKGLRRKLNPYILLG